MADLSNLTPSPAVIFWVSCMIHSESKFLTWKGSPHFPSALTVSLDYTVPI